MMSLKEAIAYANKLHAGQVDKAGRPYIEHPLRVCGLLPGDATEDEKIAGVLHDVIEDCGVTAGEMIEAGVPMASVRIVDALTRRSGEPYEAFIDRIAAAGDSAVKVKLADIEDNSAPERLALLDAATAQRLVAKYAMARATLRAALTSSAPPAPARQP